MGQNLIDPKGGNRINPSFASLFSLHQTDSDVTPPLYFKAWETVEWYQISVHTANCSHHNQHWPAGWLKMIDSRHLRKNVGEHLVRISLDSEVLNESSEFNLISGQIGTRCLNLLQSHVTTAVVGMQLNIWSRKNRMASLIEIRQNTSVASANTYPVRANVLK